MKIIQVFNSYRIHYGGESNVVSDTITLSTMHGCPPDEIEAIVLYLLNERKIHTSVKCNPTLLGADRVRGIINDDLGFSDIPVPVSFVN